MALCHQKAANPKIPFDSLHDSDELALLHCWSLSLEDQFYLLWPISPCCSIQVGQPERPSNCKQLACWLQHRQTSATFFLTPFRVLDLGVVPLVLYLQKKLSLSSATREALSGVQSFVASMMVAEAEGGRIKLAALTCTGYSFDNLGWRRTKIDQAHHKFDHVGIGAVSSIASTYAHWPIIFFARFIFVDVADTPLGVLGEGSDATFRDRHVNWVRVPFYSIAQTSNLPVLRDRSCTRRSSRFIERF